MKIKYGREIKVGILALVCLLILYFGFNFLKGFNIFSSVNNYYGIYPAARGLSEQAPVYIRGYKVGQVDAISYDFTRDSAFVVEISIHSDIRLPKGTTMDLISDGLLEGTAIVLTVPNENGLGYYEDDAFLPTVTVPGLMDKLQATLLENLDNTIVVARTFLSNMNEQLADDHLKRSLANIDKMSGDLTQASKDLKHLMAYRVPGIVDHLDTTLANIEVLSTDLREANLKRTVARVDTAIDQVNLLLADARSTDGTLGLLLNNKRLYFNVNSTIQSADSLLVDIKANPKRYVHFSLFGAKDKRNKKKNGKK